MSSNFKQLYISAVLLTLAVKPALFNSNADMPDDNLEAQLHGIFLNYHNQPTPQEQWSAVVGSRQTEVFEIRNGDTLWDISTTLFADGNFWPKIWSINSGITNPHLISPGMVIQFAVGDAGSPPAFTITEKSALEVKSTAAVEANNNANYSQVVKPDGTVERIEIPKPSRNYSPVLEDLPQSLPTWQSSQNAKYDESGIEFVKRQIVELQDKVTLTAYVTEEPPEPQGRVTETESGSSVSGLYQYVYLSFQPGTAKVGEKYLIVSPKGKLKKLSRDIETRGAKLIEIQGEAELVEEVRGKDDDLDWFRALIVKAVNPIDIGATVVKGSIIQATLNKKGPRSQVVTQIIGGNEDNKGYLFGDGSLVYLNRGSNDGLNVGETLTVRKNLKSRFENSKLVEVSNPVAVIQIAYVEPEFATAIVLNAWEEIRPGDFTGEGKIFTETNLDESFDKAALDEDGSIDGTESEESIDEQEFENELQNSEPTESSSEDTSLMDEVNQTPSNTDDLGEELSWDAQWDEDSSENTDKKTESEESTKDFEESFDNSELEE